jgi:hypothetical protein
MFRVLELVTYLDEIPIIHVGFKVSYYYNLEMKYSIGGSHVDFFLNQLFTSRLFILTGYLGVKTQKLTLVMTNVFKFMI